MKSGINFKTLCWPNSAHLKASSADSLWSEFSSPSWEDGGQDGVCSEMGRL